MMKIRVICALGVLVISAGIGPAFSQTIENEFQMRNAFKITKKISKGLRVELEPQLRWTGGEGLDKYMITGGLRYKFVDYLSVSAYYRMIGKRREGKDDEFLGRYQFNLNASQDFGRWEPGFRFAYTNYTDENEDGQFFRYRASLDYDIPGCRLTPGAGFELYHDLDEGNVYKYRSKIDLNYKLSAKLYLNGGYRYDFYKTQAKNRHILKVGLRWKL